MDTKEKQIIQRNDIFSYELYYFTGGTGDMTTRRVVGKGNMYAKDMEGALEMCKKIAEDSNLLYPIFFDVNQRVTGTIGSK